MDADRDITGGNMSGLSRLIAPVAVAALLTSAALATSTPPAAPADRSLAVASGLQLTLALPAPTGRHPVGLDTLHLRDPDRADPWVGSERRELMLSVWYPAAGSGAVPARYVSPAESALIMAGIGAGDLPPEILSTTRVHAGVGAPPTGRRLPLVVLSPGFTFPRSSLTALAEELASRGYVVAGVDHTYEAAAITFPDGRITDCLACRSNPDPVYATAGRARDISFVIDRLTARRSAWRGGHRIDPDRIAVLGHSLGGAAAAEAMLGDRRIRAGGNLDGSFRPGPLTAFDRPFLLLGAEATGPGEDVSWDRTWSNLTGWRRWLTVDGTTHSSFTDYGILGDQVGLPLQPLAGDRCGELTRAYVVAFVDRQLRGHPAPLLAGPSDRYPEVRFWQP
jgi:predicted dienelactone hydrolase